MWIKWGENGSPGEGAQKLGEERLNNLVEDRDAQI